MSLELLTLRIDENGQLQLVTPDGKDLDAGMMNISVEQDFSQSNTQATVTVKFWVNIEQQKKKEVTLGSITGSDLIRVMKDQGRRSI